jgi:excinuclease ABC subunit A
MSHNLISVRGARQHNLKNVSIDLPRNQLIVLTGLSGSGKSSLAFDTIYAEGQRRYVESLSTYARQLLGQMDKPDVDSIDGLSPAIAIDQHGVGHNPRSTVGTVTEIYDFLRLLYARVGRPHCPNCGRPIRALTPQQMVETILALPEGSRVMLLAPLAGHQDVRAALDGARRNGYVRARVDGTVVELADADAAGAAEPVSAEIVIDRLIVRHGGEDGDAVRARLADSVETALAAGEGSLIVAPVGSEELRLSRHWLCPVCAITVQPLEPRSFSFNSPQGACLACDGLGVKLEFDAQRILPNHDLSLDEGAVAPWSRFAGMDGYYPQLLKAAAEHVGQNVKTPLSAWSADQRHWLLHGRNNERIRLQYTVREGARRDYATTYEGVVPILERQHRESTNERVREDLERYMAELPCAACHGARLKPEVLAVTVAGLPIAQVVAQPLDACARWLDALTHADVAEPLTERERLIAQSICRELLDRLGFLLNVGLGYLTLDRRAGSLSGGEAQRTRLATQIGSRLSGVLYVLDEPSIGLHQRDNDRLLATLAGLRDLQNTVLVVEHDEETMRAADWLVDIGPGAGDNGGEIVAAGPPSLVEQSPLSITGRYLRGDLRIPTPRHRRPGNGEALLLDGVIANNLKDITVRFPLGCLIGVTGVSGSGKSTLVNDVLYRLLAQHFTRAQEPPGAYRGVTGLDQLDKVIAVDQAPIGRTPRSNPATYVGLFTPIRELFAKVPEAKVRGYSPGRFSFNVRGGRCEACKGEGVTVIEMQFLPTIYVPCDVCHGKRYNQEALEIRYRGRSIADVLDMTVEEAAHLFEHIPALAGRLETLRAVGLGYIHLGQPATTLSGGEAQRVKLAAELGKRSTGGTLYILDEPTTGLHFADVQRLLEVLNRLVDAGNTVLVIEHNLDVIKSADWLVDLGPEAGAAGGEIVAQGTPEQVAATPKSITGQYLLRVLERG